ncbi:MAG: PAS domain S-box protein [Bacteroidota bacterium]
MNMHDKTSDERSRKATVAHDDMASNPNHNAGLNENELFFKSIFDQHSSIQLLIEPDSGLIIEANEAAVAFYGYTKSKLCSMYIYEINMFSHDQIKSDRLNASQNKRNYFIFPHKLANGEIRAVEVHSSPIQFKGKKILFSIIHDITERNLFEGMLLETEANLSAVFNSTDESIYLIAADDTLLALNSVAAKRLNALPEQLIGLKVSDFMASEVIGFRKPFIDEVFASAKPLSFEDSRDGRWMKSHIYPIVNASGIVDRIAIYSRDITEKKHAEAELQLSSKRLNQAQELGNMGSFSYNLTNGLVTTSTQMDKIIGLYPNQLTKLDTWKEMLHPEDKEKIKIAADNCLQKGIPIDIDYRIIRPSDKKTVWLRCSAKVEYSLNGEAEFFLGVNVDITARKQSEKALEESEMKYRSLFENSLMAISIVEPDGRLVQANRAFAQMYGYHSVEEIIKEELNVKQLYATKADRSEVLKKLYEDGSLKAREVEVLRKDGTHLFVLLSSTVIYDESGNPKYFLSNQLDISELKIATENLNESEKIRSSFFNASPDFIFLKNENFEHLFGNEALCRFYSTTLENLLGKTDFELMDEAFASLCRASDQKAIELNELHISEETFGNDVYETVKFPVEYVSGKIGIGGYIRNVTQRKLSEEKLKNSEDRFRAIIESSPIAMAINNEQLQITYLNPAFIQAFGYTLEDVPTVSDWFPKAYPHPEYREKITNEWIAELELVKKYQKTFSPKEVKVHCKDGTDKIAIVSATEFSPTYKGEHLVIFQDITERKHSEENLKKSESSLDYAQEISKMGSWEYDLHTNKNSWSKNCFVLFGLNPDEVDPTFEYFKSRIHPDDLHFIDESLETIHKYKKPIAIEIRITFPDGTYKWLQNNIVPIFKDKILVALKGTNVDITESKNAENIIKEKMNELEQWHRLTVGREVKMIELKKEVNELCKQMGQEEKYNIVE